MNKPAANAQMESEEDAAVRVRSIGDRASRARNTMMEDLRDFAPA